VARELCGVAPQPTPEGLWPTIPTPSPAPCVEAAPVEVRKPPVAIGALPSGTTVIRPIRFEGKEDEA